MSMHFGNQKGIFSPLPECEGYSGKHFLRKTYIFVSSGIARISCVVKNCNIPIPWRIQDFEEAAAPTYYLFSFAENCAKMN